MSISTFGGSYTATSSTSGTVVGEMINVPFSFKQTGYVDAGSTFSSTQYPSLAAVLPPSFAADLWAPIQGPNLPVSCNSYTMNNLTSSGGFINAVSFANEYFVFFANGSVFRTTGGSTSSMAFFTQLSIPTGNLITQAYVANGLLFVSFNVATTVNVYSELTLTTVQTASIGGIVGPWNVSYGNSLYIAFKQGTSTAPYTSPDGINWTLATVPTTSAITGIDWNGTTWLLATVGTTGSVYATSSTGASGSWTAITGTGVASAHMRWNSVLSLFVVIPSAAAAIYTSPTGLASSWTARTTLASITPKYLDIGTNGYMTCSPSTTSGSTAVYGSPDGVTWTQKSATGFQSTVSPFYGALYFSTQARMYGSNVFVIGQTGYSGSTIYGGQHSYSWSTDGAWTTLNAPTAMYATTGTPAYNTPVYLQNGNCMILESQYPGANINTTIPGCSGIGNPYYSISTNGGKTWSTPVQLPALAAPTTVYWRYIGATPTHYIVIGFTSTAMYMYSSSDGVNWSQFSTSAANSVNTDNVRLYINGETIYMYSSLATTTLYSTTNYGQTWVANVWPSGYIPTGISGPNFFYVGPSGSGQSYIQVAQINTITAPTQYGSTTTAITNGYIQHVLVTPNCVLMTTTTNASGSVFAASNAYFISYDNGASWAQKTFPVGIVSKGACYYNGYIIIFTSAGGYIWSTDGVNWTAGSTGGNTSFPSNWANVAGSGTFVCPAGSGNTVNYMMSNYYYHSNVSTLMPIMCGNASSAMVTGDSTTYRVPYAAPFSAGAKWTVKAQ
jgi:hypothetical protein